MLCIAYGGGVIERAEVDSKLRYDWVGKSVATGVLYHLVVWPRSDPELVSEDDVMRKTRPLFVTGVWLVRLLVCGKERVPVLYV